MHISLQKKGATIYTGFINEIFLTRRLRHRMQSNLNPTFFDASLASISKAAFKYDTKDEQSVWYCLHNIGKLVLMCGIIA